MCNFSILHNYLCMLRNAWPRWFGPQFKLRMLVFPIELGQDSLEG